MVRDRPRRRGGIDGGGDCASSSRETAATIIATEPRLVAAHILYTVAWFLIMLGLPGLYVAQRGGMGKLGLAGFLTSMLGTYLIAVTGYFGFLAPVLARESPAALDGINQYSPVVISNGLAAIAFMIGYALLGIAIIRTPTLPRLSGVLVAVGAPLHLLGFGISQLVSTAVWVVAVIGAACLGAGLGWPGYQLWQSPAARGWLPTDERSAV
jgi:enamine deaminase RidA (YjgF/YER057c/UK114 family)